MANLILKSKNQILASMISKLLADTGVNDLNPGSVVVTLLELAAAEDFQQYYQLLNIIRNYNLDTTTGADLDNRATEFGLTRNKALAANGLVTIYRQAGFQKVSTALYTGFPAPLAGDTVLRVNDASNALYGTSGTLIVGRGTSVEEQVTYSSAPLNVTNYWEFTVSPLSNNHTLGESVILKQDITVSISAGTLLVVPATSNSPQLQFSVDQDTVLLTGEAQVDNIAVTCTTPGSIGNIPIEAINGTDAFSSPPFPGARATNLSKFTNGRDLEQDDDLRNRIKNVIQSLSKGTARSILTDIVGLVDPNTAKRVVSANIIEPTSNQDPVKVYIDDGTGFEPSFLSQGFESVVTQASGGESRLQLDQFPLVKAQVESAAAEPYDLSSGPTTLSYQVGIASETITIYPADFIFPNSATAQDIVAVINSRSTLLEARTAEVGSTMVLAALSDTNEDIQITGGTANSIFLFPTAKKSTLLLYKDDVLLSKDGSTAFVDSLAGPYNFPFLGASPWVFNLIVDGKSANTISVSLVPGDFVNPSVATVQEVVTKFNATIPGATASVINGNAIRISSNTELSSKSIIQVTGGSANTLLQFSLTTVMGTNSDYILNRELGQLQLVAPLTSDQLVTAGSQYTRAHLRCLSSELYSIISGQTLKVIVDGGSLQTIAFPSTGSYTASQVAGFINASLLGATALSRDIGGVHYLEINTNSYNSAFGSLQITSASTATGILFTYNTTVTNEIPNKAYLVSSITGPYGFVQGDNLVVIVDNKSSTNTFNVVLNYLGNVTSVSGASQFSCLPFNIPFSTTGALNNFYAVFTSGVNTTTGSIASVANAGGSTFQYNFSSLPGSLSQFNIGDQVTFSGLSNLNNNGSFVITGISLAGNGYVRVTNSLGVAEPSASGSAKLGNRRPINAYNGLTGAITVSPAFPLAPGLGDTFIVIPSTLSNLVYYMNNLRVTSLSLVSVVQAVNNNTQLQISSIQEGSNGYINVTGGSANLKLGFSTTQLQGLAAYNYYTGLTKIVNQTIYGDDTDLVTYPGVGAAGVNFQILAPTVNEIEVNVILTLSEGVSISSVQDNVLSAITGYINGLGIASPVIVSEIIDVVMNLPNVVDVKVVAPTVNIQIKDNELARTRSNLITIS